MNHKLYPLKFEPIYQYRLWGGRKLEHWLSKPLPKDESTGEAWILSDRKDHASLVTDGELKGKSLTELLQNYQVEIMGKLSNRFDKFPLLLKCLDAKEVLSVQVHPSDEQKEYIPKGDSGKTEAWIVLETSAKSRIYAGLKKGTTKKDLKESIKDNSFAEKLHSFVPKKDDAVFIPSGTVHTLVGTVVFEVQENSDVTFRLYDWDRIDTKIGRHRELQVENALACIDFNQINIDPVTPVVEKDLKNIEVLFDNDHFKLYRIKTISEFKVGFKNEPCILVCLEGNGSIEFNVNQYPINKGEVMLLPAIIGQLNLQPKKEITFLQIAIPDKFPI